MPADQPVPAPAPRPAPATWLVRPATLDDVVAIAGVHRASWRETYTGHLPEEVIAHYEAPGLRETQWRETLEAEPAAHRAHVGIVDGEIVGVAWARLADEPDAPREWELKILYTLARTHGSGLGQALVEATIGDGPAYLWVSEGNTRAERFYARLGFRPETPPARRWETPPFDIRLVR